MAPAESRADADGEGGGRTTTALWGSAPLRCAVSAVVRGEAFDPAVLLPASDCSSGICTFKRGLAPPPDFRLFEREGGLKVVSGLDDVEAWGMCAFVTAELLARCGGGGGEEWPLVRATAPTSTDCARLVASSLD